MASDKEPCQSRVWLRETKATLISKKKINLGQSISSDTILSIL